MYINKKRKLYWSRAHNVHYLDTFKTPIQETKTLTLINMCTLSDIHACINKVTHAKPTHIHKHTLAYMQIYLYIHIRTGIWLQDHDVE